MARHAQSRGVTLQIEHTEGVYQQSQAIARLVRQQVHALIIGPRERVGLAEAIGHARAEGVPVVIVDNMPVDCAGDSAVIADNYGGGALIAEHLAGLMGGQGKLLHIAGPSEFQSAIDRAEGVRAALRGHPSIAVIEAVADTFNAPSGRAIAQAALAEHPDLRAICAANDMIAGGALAALADAGSAGRVLVTGFDASPDALNAIRGGRMIATIHQPLRTMSEAALDSAISLAQGRPAPARTDSPCALITAENLIDATIDALDILPAILSNALASTTTLEQERNNLQTLINALPETLIFIKDRDGRYLMANRAMLAAMGRPNDGSVLGKTDYDFYPSEVADRYHAEDMHILTTGEPILDRVHESNGGSGKHLWRQVTKVPLRDFSGHVVGVASVVRDITSLKEAEAEQLALREEIIRAQEMVLRELSTPLIPISDDVLIMPLIGAIDTRRAQQILETLLQGVAAHGGSTAIIDITGVSVVDTQVANALVQAARAVKLLGASVILSGVGPEIAQTLIGLGVDLTGIKTLGTLQRSVAYALGRKKP